MILLTNDLTALSLHMTVAGLFAEVAAAATCRPGGVLGCQGSGGILTFIMLSHNEAVMKTSRFPETMKLMQEGSSCLKAPCL